MRLTEPFVLRHGAAAQNTKGLVRKITTIISNGF
jgi:hypothetical protein